jgi:predicted regulator of Ras-like GTPase activity (Roadblock/LC7/MglB family)
VESAGLRPPAFVQRRFDAGSVLAAPGPDDLVLVAVVGPDANLGLARLEMIEAAGSLG